MRRFTYDNYFRTLLNKERVNRIDLCILKVKMLTSVSVVNYSIKIVKACWLQLDSVHGNMFIKL